MSSTAPGIGEEWDVLSGLLPQPDTGQPRRHDRVVLNGIVWKLRTDPGWRDVPERGVSPGGRCTHVSAGGRPMACSRSSARGRRPKEGRPRRDGTRPGRSRVELTTKIHLACDGPSPRSASSSPAATPTTARNWSKSSRRSGSFSPGERRVARAP
ncbi:transposase [Streptomyces sp. NPDC060322]|uniref:transposase n=1 Tax=Streptomyces sp. NPDC060322 TaxID=3347097 RepID=UPI00364A43C2